MNHYLSICAIIKDETPYLKEWIAYHALLKTDHFYLYDNGSKIPVKETLSKEIDEGLVSVINFPGAVKQIPAYNDCLQNFGNQTKWLAYIDADEFICPTTKNSIPEVLRYYEAFGALNPNWLVFGASGNINKTNSLVIESYIQCGDTNWDYNNHTKAIVQPEKTIKAGTNPHHFIYKPGYYAVSEKYKTVPNAWSPFSNELIQINHYFTKSFEEYKEKMDRGRADIANCSRNLEEFEMVNHMCVCENKSILRFVEQVKEKLK